MVDRMNTLYMKRRVFTCLFCVYLELFWVLGTTVCPRIYHVYLEMLWVIGIPVCSVEFI